MKRILVALILTLLPLCMAAAQSGPVTCSSSLWQVDTLTSSDSIATPVTPAFANLADMSLGFYSVSDSCVKIDVSFVVTPSSAGQFEVRATYDGSPITVPASVKVGPGLPLGYHTFTFTIYSGSGTHGVRVQIRGAGGGALVTTDRMIVVTH